MTNNFWGERKAWVSRVSDGDTLLVTRLQPPLIFRLTSVQDVTISVQEFPFLRNKAERG